jgi:hypothetical protein
MSGYTFSVRIKLQKADGSRYKNNEIRRILGEGFTKLDKGQKPDPEFYTVAEAVF